MTVTDSCTLWVLCKTPESGTSLVQVLRKQLSENHRQCSCMECVSQAGVKVNTFERLERKRPGAVARDAEPALAFRGCAHFPAPLEDPTTDPEA